MLITKRQGPIAPAISFLSNSLAEFASRLLVTIKEAMADVRWMLAYAGIKNECVPSYQTEPLVPQQLGV